MAGLLDLVDYVRRNNGPDSTGNGGLLGYAPPPPMSFPPSPVQAVWRMMPLSTNFEDRRDGGLYQSALDLLQRASLGLSGQSPFGSFEGSKSRPTGSSYADDIYNAAQQDRLRTILSSMGQRADAQATLNAYFDANEKLGK